MSGLTAVIADDHELFRAALTELLRREIGFRTVVQAETFEEAMHQLKCHPDAAFACIDLAMPGMQGSASFHAIRERCPNIRIAVVTASERREDILMALGAGVHGFIPKTFRIAQMATALRTILEGGIFVPPQLALTPAPRRRTSACDRAQPRSPQQLADEPLRPGLGLSARQEDVSRLMAQGKSNKEIAQALGLAENTIKVHVHALYRSLGTHNRVLAVAAVASRTRSAEMQAAERQGAENSTAQARAANRSRTAKLPASAASAREFE
jgi:DNA-binding NarL/FixJ family response regulator